MLEFNKIVRGFFILGMAALVAYLLVTPTGAIMSGVLVTLMLMVGLTRGEIERMLPWFIFSLVFVHFGKRALFLGDGAPAGLYYQLQALPVFLMTFLLICAMRRYKSIPLRFPDYLVAGYFLLGTVLTLGKSFQTGDFMVAVVSLAQHSAATLSYFIGRCLKRDVWQSVLAPVLVCVGLAVCWGGAQLILGGTSVDVKWALSMGNSSLQAMKVINSLFGESVFRPYATFADPLQFGLFITFAWCITEMAMARRGSSALGRMVCRCIFIGCLALTMSRSDLLAGLGMFFFAWLLGRRVAGHPVLVFSGFGLGFIGVVFLVDYLLNNVIDASWFPHWSSQYLNRLFDIGTLTQRGYALEEFWRAFPDYGIIGVGWKDQQGLTAVGSLSGRPQFESHNGIVNLLVTIGGVGLFVVIFWFATWLKRVYTAIQNSDGTEALGLRWGAAMILGYMSTIFFSGQGFLNDFFWLMVGWTTTRAMPSDKGDL